MKNNRSIQFIMIVATLAGLWIFRNNLAVIWAWLLLGELPGTIQLLGGLLIVGGVVLVRVDELRVDQMGMDERRVAEPDPLDHANDVEPVP